MWAGWVARCPAPGIGLNPEGGQSKLTASWRACLHAEVALSPALSCLPAASFAAPPSERPPPRSSLDARSAALFSSSRRRVVLSTGSCAWPFIVPQITLLFRVRPLWGKAVRYMSFVASPEKKLKGNRYDQPLRTSPLFRGILFFYVVVDIEAIICDSHRRGVDSRPGAGILAMAASGRH